MKKFRMNQVLIALLILTGALVAGIADYVQAGFDFSVLTKPSFWVNIITTNIGVLCIILAILLSKIDRFKLEDPNYLVTYKEINDFYIEHYVPAVFRKFGAERNRKSKILAYKYKINKKYTQLKPSPKDLAIFKDGTEEQKEKNKYCIKVKYYNNLLDDNYIESTIDKRYVKYNSISEGLIFSGIEPKDDTENYVTKNKVAKVAKDLLPKFSLSLGLSLVLSSVIPDVADGITIAMVIKTCTKVFSMCMQIYFAINYANSYCEEVVLHDIRFRKDVISEYRMWFAAKEKAIKSKEEV